jgi:hypothetical protein
VQDAQPPKSLSPRIGVPRDQDTEMQLGQRDGADRKLALQFANVAGDDDAGVKQRSHALPQGSRNS